MRSRDRDVGPEAFGGADVPRATSLSSLEPTDLFAPLLEEHSTLRRLLPGTRESSVSLRRFLALLHRHMEREDTVLYPVCEDLFGGREGAVAVMRQDHAVLAGKARHLGRLLQDGSREGLAEHVDVLAQAFHAHTNREELVLFPFVQLLLPLAETEALGRRLRTSGQGRRSSP